MPSAVPEITVADLAARLRRGEDLDLVDVREPWEWGLARIDGARLVPLATIGGAVGTFDGARDVVVYCHLGVRSAAAVRSLLGAGVGRVVNLAGGIDAWSAQVDPRVPRY
jgi:rhodanese-related sulfurtransferase